MYLGLTFHHKDIYVAIQTNRLCNPFELYPINLNCIYPRPFAPLTRGAEFAKKEADVCSAALRGIILVKLTSYKSKKIATDFSGGNITSNGGVLLLKQADAKLELTRATARAILDARHTASVRHTIEQMFRQRVHAIGCGEEDLNNHDEFNHAAATWDRERHIIKAEHTSPGAKPAK